MLNENNRLVSKVLVLDDAQVHFEALKAFCEECGLVGIRPQRGDAESVTAILGSNVDLGGILLFENYGGPGLGIALARKIHRLRPELPLFLRRETVASVAGLDEQNAAMFRCAYTLADLQQLRATLDASIFSRVYPNELVRGIADLTRDALQTLFRNCDIDVETPYLVKDRIIYGEVFTMIAIESAWCRGYMMLQCEEGAVLDLVGRADGDADKPGFRELNAVLGEATNLVWGSFKNRYAGQPDLQSTQFQTQVPIIINHQRRYISFGSEEPQLCLKYVLRDRDGPAAVPIFQRFVFNLNWSPESFRETPSVESFVESGELELF